MRQQMGAAGVSRNMIPPTGAAIVVLRRVFLRPLGGIAVEEADR